MLESDFPPEEMIGSARAHKNLLRAIIGYAPANIVPALMAIATIVVFTRLLPPHELGYFTFAQACFTFGQVVAFSSLQLSVTRFFVSEAAGQRRWIASAYRGYLAFAAVTAAIFAAIILIFVSDPMMRHVLWIALPALLLRGLVMVHLGIHRRLQNTRKYNVIECGQPVIAFVVGVALVIGGGMGAPALVWGLLIASASALLLDLPLLAKAWNHPDMALMKDMARYGTPLSLTYALSSFSAYADRGFILGFLGTATLGVYGIAYNLVDRATSLIFLSINVGAFPMALIALDNEGPDAARAQMKRTGMVLLTLAVPASAGLACSAHSIAAILVGAQYRAEVGAILPWLCLSLLIRGLAVHFFEHSFHLGRKTNMSLAALVPVALLNLVLNAFLIPWLGIEGALIAGILTQILALALNIVIGRRVFRLDFPFQHAIRVLGSVLPMCAVVLYMPVSHGIIGLIVKIGAGAMAYIAVGWAFGLSRPLRRAATA